MIIRTNRAYLLLGSNMGQRERNLSTAISLLVTELAPYLFSEVFESSVRESEPWGFESQGKFLNQAIAFDTSVSPEDLLKVCKYVEHKMGRPLEEPLYDEAGNRIYRDRVIDIDILIFGDIRMETPELSIPHPRLEERDFAMIPLKELRDRGI
ncbi:MAG: 2-amino-4-hydroxy-6-hydroxymethyldihydropteridine diphosphokinase [Alistipes sp.]|nr:2-amino-4-hydroxy-6-hydroxymethyldihydropteridine diphosphokinase [Candidatus Minthomonas equi]